MSKTLLRALALLLVLGLLAGCAVTTRRPSGRTDGALTHEKDDPAPDKPDGDDPESRPNRAPDKPESPETPTVTAGGVAVHTDYSAYTPYAAPEPVYTRLTPEHIADLKASDDYGAIYPFMGERLYSPSGWGNGGYFGFFDDSGRIVADPTYSSVIQMCSYTGRSMEYKPYWLLSRTCNVRTTASTATSTATSSTPSPRSTARLSPTASTATSRRSATTCCACPTGAARPSRSTRRTAACC